MALIKCSECSKEISDKASACIGCGAPLLSTQDEVTALVALQAAADQGYPIAQRILGARYESGDGVSIDFDKAIYWYQLAAEQGDAEAQKNLGVMCSKGQVVLDGVLVGDVTGDGKVDYEDFKLAISRTKQFTSPKVEEAVSYGHERLQSAKEKDAAALQKLASNSGPISSAESQVKNKREKFKAALESTIDVKFADILRGKTGTEVYLTYFDAQILTASVRNVFKHLLHLTPPQVEAALSLSEAVLAPSVLQKIQLIKTAIGAAGAAAGIGIVLASVGTALGWGASATSAFIGFFTTAHIVGPVMWATSGLALAGFAGYFAMTSNNQTNSERFIKVLKNSTGNAVDTIWQEHEAVLSKILSSDVSS